MAKLGGRDLVSETTQKVVMKAYTVATVIILVKIYDVDIDKIKFLEIEFPGSLVDTGFAILICYYLYSLVLNWYTDFIAFRYWFRENSILSNFQTTLPLDAKFLDGGKELIEKLVELEINGKFPKKFDDLSPEVKNEYASLKQNIELWTVRLNYTKTSFKLVTSIGKFYLVVHSLLIPVILLITAFYLIF